jgi:hypothetical protein
MLVIDCSLEEVEFSGGALKLGEGESSRLSILSRQWWQCIQPPPVSVLPFPELDRFWWAIVVITRINQLLFSDWSHKKQRT